MSEHQPFYAGGFLHDPRTDAVLLHLRDGNTRFFPHHWSLFGGLSEDDETPIACFVREIKEELDLDLTLDEIRPLCSYLSSTLNIYRHIFFVSKYIDRAAMTLGEGADFAWIDAEAWSALKLSPLARRDLTHFFSERDSRGEE